MGSVGVAGPLRLLMVATVVICGTRGTELDYINHAWLNYILQVLMTLV